jgi:phosphatidylglycerophosphatase A
MRERLVKFLATGFSVGYLPLAPGTAGSVVGIGFWWALQHEHHLWLRGVFLVLAIALAVWCAGEASDIMHHPDPPSVVIDEIVAMPIALIGLGATWWQILAGFALFRLFDIWKPSPIRDAQDFSGGIGIVLDDLLAAAAACATTHGIVWLVSWMKH